MTSDSPGNIPLRRAVMAVIFAVTVGAYLVAPVLALNWAQQPFMGAFVEHTGVVSQINGLNWHARQSGLPGGAKIIAIDNQPVADAAAIRAYLSTRLVGESISIDYTLADGARGRLNYISLQAFPVQDLVANFWLPYLLGLGYLALGAWAYRNRGALRATQAFGVFCCFTALTLGLFFDMNTTQVFVRVWTAALPLAGAALISLALLFPETLPRLERRPRLRLIPYAPAILVALYANFVLYDAADPRAYFIGWRLDYACVALGLAVMVATAIVRQRHSHTAIARQQARIIVLGSLVAFGPILLWALQAAASLSVPFMPAVFFTPLIAFPAAIAYAIVRYRLLDVDRLVSQGLGYAVLTLVVVGGYFVLIQIAGLVLRAQVSADEPGLLILLVLLLVLGLNPLRDRIQRAVDRVFYRDRVDYRKALEDFSHDLTGTLDLDTILAAVRRRIDRILHPDRQFVHLYDEESRTYFEVGDDEFEAPPVGAESALARYLARENQVTYLLPHAAWPTGLEAGAELIERLGTPVFVPLRSRDQLTGWLSLGPKRSGQLYRSDDLSFLAAFANQTAVAIENARLFDNVRRNLIAITTMKNLMDNVLASIPSGVITTDINERITLFNRAAEEILGVPAHEIMGRPFTLVEPLSRPLQTLIRAVAEQQTMQSQEVASVLPRRGAVALQMRATPLRDNRAETLGVAIVVDDLTEQKRLEAVREMFRRYVSPAVVDNLPDDPAQLKLGGQRRVISVLFADIRGFTAYSQQLAPEELVDILNQYISLAAGEILTEEGTLDKFVGDAIMGIFNAPLEQPDHALRAARAALGIQAALAAYRQRMPEQQQLQYGIGLNLGEAVVGNIGIAQRLDYTAIGDCVNYAKRLQENARGGQILLSRSAYEAISDHVVANALPPLEVKGRRGSEPVYELLRLKD